jgi:hypothetical protein
MRASCSRIFLTLAGMTWWFLSMAACTGAPGSGMNRTPEAEAAIPSGTAPTAGSDRQPFELPPQWTPTPTITPTPGITSTPSAETPDGSPSGTMAAQERPVIADWESLDTLRAKIVVRLTFEPDSVSFEWRIAYEWIKEPPAMHQVVTMGGSGIPGGIGSMTTEVIQIGNTLWYKAEGAWIKAEYSQTQMEEMEWAGVEKNFRDLNPVGEETVNGIPCIHYTVDEDTRKVTGGGYQDMTTHAVGDLWVAHRTDLPPVTVKLRVKMITDSTLLPMPTSTYFPTMEMTEAHMVYQYDYDLTAVNVPIVIDPPAENGTP